MSQLLYQSADHSCIMLSDTTLEHGAAVQANQFVIIDHNAAAVIDPGGSLGFNETLLAVRGLVPMGNLAYIMASHADPDVIGALDRWLTSAPQAQVVLPQVWARFAPHFTKGGKSDGRIFGVPDEGGRLALGGCELVLLPAHFLHSEGNIQFYDPISKILFSGDLGASVIHGAAAETPVTQLAPHIAAMEGFHKRYMVSNKILRLWVSMVRELDINMIVPQHGAPIVGKAAIADFYRWLEDLACGVDLMSTSHYRIPTGRLLPQRQNLL
jgi:flavorubredoxin